MSDFIDVLYAEHNMCNDCPKVADVSSFFERLLGLLYQDFSEINLSSRTDIERELSVLEQELTSLLSCQRTNEDLLSSGVVEDFFRGLPQVRADLNEDVTAIYEGDPACQSEREVIRSYPGFLAMAAYRVAHSLHLLGVHDLPRIITEYAHRVTSIDIHPGAQIAPSFCIDHGTGIVIGETAVIEEHVKIYQGVTLGALSVEKEDAGSKRHPTIQRHTVIYANATILGGQTVIGHDSIIGGNTWITRSVPPHSKIYYQASMNSNEGDLDQFVFKNMSA